MHLILLYWLKKKRNWGVYWMEWRKYYDRNLGFNFNKHKTKIIRCSKNVLVSEFTLKQEKVKFKKLPHYANWRKYGNMGWVVQGEYQDQSNTNRAFSQRREILISTIDLEIRNICWKQCMKYISFWKWELDNRGIRKKKTGSVWNVVFSEIVES